LRCWPEAGSIFGKGFRAEAEEFADEGGFGGVQAEDGGGGDGGGGGAEGDEDRAGVGEAADFGGGESDAAAGGDKSEEGGEAGGAAEESGGEAGGLAGAADEVVAAGKGAFSQAEEGFFGEFGQAEGFAEGEAVVIGQDGLEGNAVESGDGKFWSEFGAGIADESDIQPAGAERLDLFTGGEFENLDFEAGLEGLELAEGGGEQRGEDGGDAADDERLGGWLEEGLHGLNGLDAAPDEIAGVGEESFTRGSEAGAMAIALEEFHAEFILEILDLAADGGLGDAEAGGGAAEIEFFSDGDEVAEVAQFHLLTHSAGARVGGNDNRNASPPKQQSIGRGQAGARGWRHENDKME